MTTTIEKPLDVFQSAQTNSEYLDMLNQLLAEDKTTGDNHSEAYLNYTKQNLQRKKRTEKTFRISEEDQQFFASISRPMKWLAITEGWCGDASSLVPVFNKLSQLNENIEFRVTLRDEHLSLMDQFLTNGARSIPVLVFIDAEKEEVLGHWGPRPEEAQAMMMDMKAKELPFSEITYELQKWYARDKSQSTIKEIRVFLEKI